MPRFTLDLSDEQLAALLLDLGKKAGSSKEIAVAVAKKKPKKKTAPTSEASGRRGRKIVSPTGEKLEFRSLGLEPDLWTWVEGQAASVKLTTNQFIRRNLLKLKESDS